MGLSVIKNLQCYNDHSLRHVSSKIIHSSRSLAGLMLMCVFYLRIPLFSRCPPGWVTDGISNYYMMRSRFNKMADARQQCQNLGADLPIISSAKENNFILDLLEKEGKDWASVGFLRNVSDMEFYWVNGSELRGKYSAWNAGEPNNSDGVENCAYMKGYRNINKGKWNDCRCDIKQIALPLFARKPSEMASTLLCQSCKPNSR